MKHLFIRIIKQRKNDKRSLALIFIAPLIVLTLLYLILGESSYEPIIASDNMPKSMIDKLNNDNVTVIDFPSNISVEDYLKDKKADAVITINNNGIEIKMLENDNVKPSIILNKIKKTMTNNFDIKIDFLYGKNNTNLFDSMAYILLGFISFFFVFLLSGISFIREKNYSTMERMMMTPIKRWEVIVGYTLGFGVISAIQSIVIVSYAKYILDISFEGSILLAFLIMVIMSLAAVSIGAFVSIFSNNEFQIMQFIPVVVIPQLLFSGIISLDAIPFGLGKLAYIMPIFYGCNGLDKVIIKGEGLSEILPNISALIIMLIIFSIINILVLKKYRKI